MADEMVANSDRIMVTLTYRNIEDWQPKHVTQFIRKVRRVLGLGLLGYFWVAEMQQRGAVHYHVVLAVRHGARMPKPDEAGLWVHGLTRIELVRHVYAYLSKYLQKDGQKAKFPRGIRTFGYSFYVLKDNIKLFKLPSWLQENICGRVAEQDDLSSTKGLIKRSKAATNAENSSSKVHGRLFVL
ncbi:MAG: hypothetical protein WEC16_01460 [Anaerolineales bacterium]